MNMFRRGRKAKEQTNETWDALSRPESPQSLFKHSRTMKRKNKNYVEEEKPVFNLDSVLPDTDDFRTSLLMPGLSARFSMLREQDNPNSKLGKASDDSVLFPKRASRMNLFNHHNPLADIAEVESIRSSFKPPFAERERANSLGDGYDSDGGSIMGRSRPGEGKGNVLFGGRQKMYRIPTGCAKGPESGAGDLTAGKHLYEDDVSLSSFQQYRTKHYDSRNLGDEPQRSPATESDENASAHTSSLTFSKNRGTQSSTNSGSSNLRASTAATSVASESPATRNSSSAGTTASYKLTNDTPNASVDSFGQAASPGLRRLRDEGALLAREPSKSKSAVNMRDRFQRSGAFFTAADLRSTSPPRSAGTTQPLDFGFGDNNNNAPLTRTRTESPTLQRDHDVLASSVQPNDRGKATALGLFNKPTKEFDEQQYLERQLQMHEGRNSPFSTNSRSASRVSTDAQLGPKNEEVLDGGPTSPSRDCVSTPQLPPIPTSTPSPVPGSNRVSQASNMSGGRRTPPSRPRSKSSASATAKDNVKARVESLIRRQNAELAALEAEKLGTSERENQPATSVEDKEISVNPFDGDISSDEGDQLPITVNISAADNARLPNGDIHPAFRSELNQARTSEYSIASRTRSNTDEKRTETDTTSTDISETNSSPLTAHLGLGLSGMIRTHLRQDSDKSAIMPPPSPTPIPVPDRSEERRSVATGNAMVEDNLKEISNTNNSSHLISGEPTVDRAPSPNTVMSRKAAQMLDQAMAIRIAAAQSKAQRIVAEDIQDAKSRAPNDENETSHRRAESSETVKERREFDEELAERRRRILDRVNERERSTSPIASPRGRDLTMQAFAQPGDDHADKQRDPTTRRLEIESFGSKVRPGLESRTSDERRGRKMSLKDQQSGSPPGTGYPRVRPTLPHSRYSPQDGYGEAPSASSYGVSSSSRSARARSNSAAAERSKSRPRYIVEPNLPVPGAFPSSQPTSPMPSPQYSNGSSDHLGYQRSNSVTGGHNGFRSATSPLPDHSNAYSPQPSPMLPMSPRGHYTSLAEQGRQASYGSGRNTPTSNGRATPLGNRKRSGTKTQISEPTFISSTSSVQLVPLPSPGSPNAPPLPEMNPRRRVSGAGERSHPVLDLSNLARTPLETVPASPLFPDMDTQRGVAQSSAQSSRSRIRLRKSSSEGGNLAAKARQQALMAELAREKDRSPALPVFPNRSATSLGLRNEGGMF